MPAVEESIVGYEYRLARDPAAMVRENTSEKATSYTAEDHGRHNRYEAACLALAAANVRRATKQPSDSKSASSTALI